MLQQRASHKRGWLKFRVVRRIVFHTHARIALFAWMLKVDMQVLLGAVWHAKELIDVELQLGAFFARVVVL